MIKFKVRIIIQKYYPTNRGLLNDKLFDLKQNQLI